MGATTDIQANLARLTAATAKQAEATAKQAEANEETAQRTNDISAKLDKQAEVSQETSNQLNQYMTHTEQRLDGHGIEIAALSETQRAHGTTLSAHGKMLRAHTKKLAKNDRRQTFASNQIRADRLLDAGAVDLAYTVLSRSGLQEPGYMPTLTRYLEGYLERLAVNPNLRLYIFPTKEHLDFSSPYVFNMVECEVLPISYVSKIDGSEKTAPEGQFTVKEFSPFENVGWEWVNHRGMQILQAIAEDGTALPVTKPSVLKKRGVVKVKYEHEHEGTTTPFQVEAEFNADGRDVANKYVDGRGVVLGLGDDKATRERIRLLVLHSQRTFLGDVLVEYNNVQIWAKNKEDVESYIRSSEDLAPADAVPICALVEEAKTRREAACLESIEVEKAFFEKHVQEVAEDSNADVEHVLKCLEEMEVYKVYPEGALGKDDWQDANEELEEVSSTTDGEKNKDISCIPSYGWVDGVFF